MRLLSHVSRKYKDKQYEKYWVVIPKWIVEKLKWKKGDDLEVDVRGDKLIIEQD